MLKTYSVIFAYTGLYNIEAFESGEKVLDINLTEHTVDGACYALDALGYKCTRRDY